MLICWLWHCAARAVVIQMHERMNAFNLVSVFFRPPQKYETTVLGNAERIFMKLSPNDSGENGVCIAVPK